MVESDCDIRAHVQLGAGSYVGSGTHIGEGSYIGQGAYVQPKVHIGENVVIWPGAFIADNVADGQVAPAVQRNLPGQNRAKSSAVRMHQTA
jgi:UDP-3-O-[3-hydroxymyristoyl] glucosamine N-acyltransferase